VQTEEQLLRDDAEARAAALDISASFVVQAPAGSGKTELLIQRYLRLLTVVENPEEVLAITFTRKAAAEMQLRVLQALTSAASESEPALQHERVTWHAATAVLRRDSEFAWNLVANPRRLRIQTLDSLNAFIARTQPLTATGGAAGNTIIADAEMRALYRNAAALTLDQLTEAGDLHDATREVLVHVDTNTSIYVAYLARMLATRDQWLPFVGSGLLDAVDAAELRSQFETGLECIVLQHLEKLSACAAKESAPEIIGAGVYAAKQLRDMAQWNNPIVLLHGIDRIPGTTTDALPHWCGLAELLLTQQGDWRKRANKNQGFPPGDDGQKAAFHDLLESLAGNERWRNLLHQVRALPPTKYSDEQWSVLLALFRLLPVAVTELKRLFSERGVTDHIEVALSASNALGTADEPGDVALLLDYQVRHLLVDEMQDTSSAQYRMIEALTGGWTIDDGRTLYCVGDPMQSIYRFRNAEVGQFLLAKKAGIGDVNLADLTLRRNFRSGANLVAWFNEVFPDVLPRQDDARTSAVAYSAAVPVPELEGQGHCFVHPLFGSDKGAEADLGLQIIRDILRAHPDDDIAILVRGRTHLPELLYRLRSAGIAYKAVEIDRLTDLPEIIDVLALTRAIAHQGDRLAWLALLRSPWVGLDWTDLHTLVFNDTKSSVWELLNNDERIGGLSEFGRTAVADFRTRFAPILGSCRVEKLRDKVERAWLILGGPVILKDIHAVENVYRYLDVIEKIEVAGTLPDVAELEDALDLEHVSSNVSARIQVMTMHRAKGLQFEHVVLFGLGRRPRNREAEVLSWFDIPGLHGAPQKIISPVGPRALLEKDPVHSYIGTIEAEKDRNELGRLLYVACTRARKSLHLVGSAQVLKSGPRPDPRSLLSLLWPVVAPQYEDVYDAEQHVPDASHGERWLQPDLRRFRSPWQMPQSPDLPCVSADSVTVDAHQQVEFYWVGAGARLAGTLVHRWLQMSTDGRVQLREDLRERIPATGRRWLLEMGVVENEIDPIVTRVTEALRGIIDDERGQWILEGDGFSELALSGVVDGQVESVVLDRVRIDAGVHWIVDYKTSSHEGGDLQSFLAAESDRYKPQLTKYATLYRNFANVDVRCALYFPLLQEFVEMDV
jgi:ATP-dependent exoDNAse (exonuclease V) beta subunit